MENKLLKELKFNTKQIILNAFIVLFKKFWLFFLIGLMFSLPSVFIQAILSPRIIEIFNAVLDMKISSTTDFSPLFVLSGTQLLMRPLLIGTTACICDAYLSGKQISPRIIFEKVSSKAFKLIFTYAAYMILFAISSILVIPAIFSGVFLFYSSYAVIFTDDFGLKAFKRSVQLVKGNFFATMTKLMFLFALDYVLSFIFIFIADALPLNAFYSDIFVSVLSVPSGMLMIIAFSISFINLFNLNSTNNKNASENNNNENNI